MSLVTAQPYLQSFPQQPVNYGAYQAAGSFNPANSLGYSAYSSTTQPVASYPVSNPNQTFSAGVFQNPGAQYSSQPCNQQPPLLQQSTYTPALNPAQYSPVKPTVSQPQTWGPKPMSGGPGLPQETDSFSPSRPTDREPASHIRRTSSIQVATEGDELTSTPVRSRPGKPAATLSPAEQTVKRLEQPLIRFLDENPQIREKIDGVNLDTLTDNLTNSMGSYRVSIHNAYNKFPRFIDNTIIKQLDPQMQDSARQFFDWVRKPPTAQEMAESRTQPPARRGSPPTKKRARTPDPFMDEPPAKAAKTGWWPFNRKSKAEPDLSSVNLDALLSELQSRNI